MYFKSVSWSIQYDLSTKEGERKTMKRVMAYDLAGKDRKILSAEDVKESERRAYDFRCLNLSCRAEFHYRAKSWPAEATKEREATFVRNPSSSHAEGCDYDYENKASRHRDVSFMQGGKFHLRINFPIGSSWTDRHPERGRLTATQRRAAAGNTGKKSVSSMAALVKLLEGEFESLESPALENLVLHYQGRQTDWPSLFKVAGTPARIFKAASSKSTDKTPALLAALRPVSTHTRSPGKEKPRFKCAEMKTQIAGTVVRLRPILVCETADVAAAVETGSTMMVSGRPYIQPRDLEAVGRFKNVAMPVYFHLTGRNQMAVVDDKYGRYSTIGTQTSLFPGYNPE